MYEKPSLVDDVGPTHRLGELMDYIDSTYGPQRLMYVKFTDAITYEAYQPLAWSAGEGDEDHVVTNDVSEDNGCAAGVATRAHTTGRYGWMVVEGVTPLLMNNDDDAADGDVAILSSADGVADTGSDPGLRTALGVITEAVVTSTNLAVVRLKGLI